MKAGVVVRLEAIDVLIEKLGGGDAENFDCTRWCDGCGPGRVWTKFTDIPPPLT